ncbi:MAG: hypothetical protein GX587_11705 [Bacteroidales bacterium]|nr:hypothetical protein [Bacteroidales bacterium]
MKTFIEHFSIISVSLINIFITIRYCYLIIKKQIKPALAMWLFFTIAVALSFITYMADGNYSPLDNILNTTDIAMVSIVCLSILIWGDKTSSFNRFDLGCLIAVSLITAFWYFTRQHWITHLAVQGILVIAYFPVIKRLIFSKKNTEPFSVWILMGIAPALSLLSSKGFLATVYSVRAIISVGILLLLMLWAEHENKKNKTI